MKIYAIVFFSIFSTCFAMEKNEKNNLNEKETTSNEKRFLLVPMWERHGMLPEKTYIHAAEKLIKKIKQYLSENKEIKSLLEYKKNKYEKGIKNKNIDDELLLEVEAIYKSLNPFYKQSFEIAVQILNKTEKVRQKFRATLEFYKIIIKLAEASTCEICNGKEETTYPNIAKWIGHDVPTVSEKERGEALKQFYSGEDNVFHFSVLTEGITVIKYALKMLPK